MDPTRYYIDYDLKEYRHLSIYKEVPIKKKLSEQIPTFECVVDDWQYPFWIQFIKETCQNKYPFLFVIKTAVREFSDGHPHLPYINNEESMISLLKTYDLISGDLKWVTDAGLLCIISHGDVLSLKLTANNHMPGTIQYNISEGALPPGLVMTSDGTISGQISNVAAVKDYEFFIRCTSSTSSVTRKFSIRVQNLSPVWITNSGVIATWGANVVFNLPLVARDPEGKHISYRIDSGILPPGLALSGSTGYILGYPSVPGVYSFIAAASDGYTEVKRSFTIKVV